MRNRHAVLQPQNDTLPDITDSGRNYTYYKHFSVGNKKKKTLYNLLSVAQLLSFT